MTSSATRYKSRFSRVRVRKAVKKAVLVVEANLAAPEAVEAARVVKYSAARVAVVPAADSDSNN